MQRPDSPILNSPFAPPARHWHLYDAGVPTAIINQGRRRSENPVPIAQPNKVSAQQTLDLETGITPNELIHEIREHVERWRALPPGPSLGVTHEARRLDGDAKRGAMETHWTPAINAHGGFGRWAFVEIGDVFQAKTLLGKVVGGRRQPFRSEH